MAQHPDLQMDQCGDSLPPASTSGPCMVPERGTSCLLTMCADSWVQGVGAGMGAGRGAHLSPIFPLVHFSFSMGCAETWAGADSP